VLPESITFVIMTFGLLKVISRTPYADFACLLICFFVSMAACVLSDVSRKFLHSLQYARLSRPATVKINLRYSSSVGILRTLNGIFPSLRRISSVHSANCVQAKVNLWDEYNRVKSFVEGNCGYLLFCAVMY